MNNEHHSEVEIGSDNIFADLGLDNADELYIRACLGVQVMKILRERQYSQKEAAEFLGVKQPEVSALMRAKFSRFSQERLIGFFNKLKLNENPKEKLSGTGLVCGIAGLVCNTLENSF